MSSTSIARLIVASSFHDHFRPLEKGPYPPKPSAPIHMFYGSPGSIGGHLLYPPHVIRWSHMWLGSGTMRIVVIGGSGHVGSFLVPRLVHGGHEVVNLTRGGRAPYVDDETWSGVE